ncbi:hypothetical protein HMI55_005801 [Coelomomyces lativittatus]|nr:hypothetical protein HMI55_005801 [Coelomomyces lativittatus]
MKFSEKILHLALQQQQEIEKEEEGKKANDQTSDPTSTSTSFFPSLTSSSNSIPLIFEEKKETSSQNEKIEDNEPLDQPWNDLLHVMHADESELAYFDSYFTTPPVSTTTTSSSSSSSSASFTIPSNVIQGYQEAGEFLSKYTSGPLPKLLKSLPTFEHGFKYLESTQPSTWSLPGLVQMTQVCVQGWPEPLVVKYLQCVVYPRMKSEFKLPTAQKKKLNSHMYLTLKKCWYKPAAACQGLILPMCKHGCTLREMSIVCGLLRKLSIPLHHASAMLMVLTQPTFVTSVPSLGPIFLLLRTLLDKHYALPVLTLHHVYNFFLTLHHHHNSVASSSILLPTFPVLLHQVILIFVQRYRVYLSPTQRLGLRELVHAHWHPLISPEILRELDAVDQLEQEKEKGNSMDVDPS